MSGRQLWDTLQCNKPGAAHRARIVALAFSPDGTRLASASSNGVLRLWAASGKLLWRAAVGADLYSMASKASEAAGTSAKKKRNYPLSIAFTAGRLLLGNFDGLLRCLSTATGEQVRAMVLDTSLWSWC